MVDTVTGAGLDQASIADAINRKYVGLSQKAKNQMMQVGTTDPSAFALQNQKQLQQAQQPSQFQGAGVLQEISDASLKQNQDIFSKIRGDYGINNAEWNTSDYTGGQSKGYALTTNPVNDMDQNNPEYSTRNLTSFTKDPYSMARQALQGKTASLADIKQNSLQANEIIPSNPVAKDLAGQFNSLYSSTPIKNFVQKIGSQMGLSTTETDQLAGIVAANNMANATKRGSALQAMNWYDYGADYIDALGRYYQYKTGSPLSNTALESLKDYSKQIASGIHEARSVEQKDVPWYVPGAIGNQLFGDSFHQDVGKAIDIGMGLFGLPSFGGSQRVGAATDTLGTTGSFNKSFKTATSDGWEGAGRAIATQGLADSLAGDWSGTGTTLGLTNDAATSAAIGQVAKSALQGAGTAAINGGGWGDIATGAASAGLGSSLGNYLSTGTSNMLGEVGSKALGGAASGAVNSLFTKNSPIEGSLYGAMSGGLYGLLNSTDRNNNTYNKQTDTRNKATATTLTQLVKQLAKRRK